MHHLSKRRALACLLAFALLPSGCKKEDPQRLAAIGRKVAEKANLTLGEARGRGLLKFTGGEGPAQRVVLRLRWDSSLAATNIEVRATDGDVDMQGNVPTSQLRARAIEIAQNTVGVEHVYADKLYVSPSP